MNVCPSRKIQPFALAIILASFAVELSAGALSLENTPLFTISTVKPNLILSIDDSGSMDYEMLFDTVDGNLWWDTASVSFIDSVTGKLFSSGNGRIQTVYLFPNGSGSAGKRVFSDNQAYYAIPPIPQYAFARSSVYNKLYYDPNVTYKPWADYGLANFGDIAPASAPSDPVTGTWITVDLTQNIESDATDYTFRLYAGTGVPAGTRFSLPGASIWTNLSSDSIVTNDVDWGVSYFPATYYIKVSSGAYTINGSSGDCSTPDFTHYTPFEQNPWKLTGVDALGPDGGCLSKVEIKPATNSYPHNGARTDCANSNSCTSTEEIQNFTNWFSYYRKRHLALRAGIGQAFDNIQGIRTGLFTINHPSDVTMLNIDNSTDYNLFYQTLYSIDGNSDEASPNRGALNYAGLQFQRIGSGAPITNECQKNFTLAVTDGFSDPIGAGVRNEDGGQGSPYEDNFSDTFADIAMKYYNTVLRSDMTSNQVPTAAGCNATEVDPQLDCNENLHMNTYIAGLGALGQSIFGVTHNQVSDAYAYPPAWTDVSGVQDGRQIDDLYHGAVNGRGEIFNARSAQELRTTLASTLQGIQAKVGVASPVTFNTATLATNSAVYLTIFNSANWSGDLLSFDLDEFGNVDLSSTWSAADLLDNAKPSPEDRVILTHNGTTGVAFQWNNLSTTQQADLNLVPGGNGQNGLNFIRGDRSHEGSGKFRVRGSALGDVVHSSPVFVGKPNLSWPDTAPFPITKPDRYLDFRITLIHEPREEVVYFGGNDGILHGVKASDGEEILAYIPKNLFSTNFNEGLHYLADPRYQHRYYVDLSPAISDVYINRNGSYEWHTILVGGERAGGRGYFALDVTDPAQFSEANASDLVLWEFTAPDIGGKLGFTYSKPTIAMMENGRWAALFGNGYNDTGAGQANLFIVFIDGGLDGTWTDGSGNSNLDYILLSTGVGSITTPNGLATPAVVDIDGNGAADRAYAGDLFGNLWAFNLSDASTRGSPRTKPAWDIAYKQGSMPKPLFVGKDSTNNMQPITSKPVVAFHPNPPSGNNDPNVLVFFGTGKYLEQSDLGTALTQSFYGVYDKGIGDRNRSNLGQQTIRSASFTESDEHPRTDLRLISDNTVNYSNQYGWYIDLNLITGERVVVDPIVRGPLVFFNTWIPDSSACSSGGKGFLMSVEQLNGGEPDSPAFNINSDTKINKMDILQEGSENHAPAGENYVNGLPAQSNFLGNKRYIPGTGSKVIETRDVADFGDSGKGRLSWQQLNQ
ncbi:MAG: hypothetical protein L0Y39_12625 [Methylococcaceae bacterium]|nr:hypothetical protein [Methylococcaceae bacterium]